MHKRRKVEALESKTDDSDKHLRFAAYASHAIPDLLAYLDQDTTSIVLSYLQRHIEGTLTFYRVQDQNKPTCFNWLSLEFVIERYFSQFYFPYTSYCEDDPFTMDIEFIGAIDTFAQDMERIMPRISEIYNQKIVCEFRFKYDDQPLIFSPAFYHPPLPMSRIPEMKTVQPATLLNWLLRLAYHFRCCDVVPSVFKICDLCVRYHEVQVITIFEAILKVFGVNWCRHSSEFVRPIQPRLLPNFFDRLRTAIQAKYNNYENIFQQSGFNLLKK